MKSGIVSIVLLVVVFLVPVFVGSLVYYSQNRREDKNVSAAAISVPNAPAELTCGGTISPNHVWKTVKDLGASSPEAINNPGSFIVGDQGLQKLVIVDEAPGDSQTAQHLVAREFDVSDMDGTIRGDTSWYDVNFQNTQASMTLIKGSSSQLDLYLYGDVNAQRSIYKARWTGTKDWVDFQKLGTDSEIQMGVTGPKTTLAGNHLFRIVNNYTEGVGPNGYLQQCVASNVSLSCFYYPASVEAGKSIFLEKINSLGGTVALVGNGATVNIGSLSENNVTQLIVPTSVSAGSYKVIVGPNAILPTTCQQYDGTVNLIVKAPTAPSCYLSASSVVAGGKFSVTSINGLSGTIGMQGQFGTIVYPNLGNLSANTTASVTVPLNVLPGLYVVRVGGLGVSCGDITVKAVNKCDLNSDGVINSIDLSLASQYFGKVTDASKRYDVNGDGTINSLDLLIIARQNPRFCI